MCQFCVQHGDGKTWYLRAENYANDLESDLRRRGYMVDFVQKFEKNRTTLNAGLAVLRYLPRPLRENVSERVSKSLQVHHFGQPIPLEDCEKFFELATNITRLPCVCRGAMKSTSNAESCCIVATVTPNDNVLAECYAGYDAGPDAEGFEKLTKDEAVALLRRCEQNGLAHTAWTFYTPFVAAVCNCDLPSGCMAMKAQFGGVRTMWKGEMVATLDQEACRTCGACAPLCPFGAITHDRAAKRVTLDRMKCWGCGTCRAGCTVDAITLEPRASVPEVASAW